MNYTTFINTISFFIHFKALIIEHLSVTNYKNIRQCELELSPNVNALIGDNGQGKTNLLDALHYISFCKSATQPTDSACIMHGEPFMVLQGDYRREDGTEEHIHLGLKAGQKKQLRRNGKTYKRLTEHIGILPLVMVAPGDNAIITSGSEERRRLMDMVISQYDHKYLDALVSYNKALQQRGTLLKMEQEPDPSLMDLWEEEMAHTGEYIYKQRTAFVKSFVPKFQHYYERISQANENVSLKYISHAQRGPLNEILRQSRAKDRIIGYSLHGIHRDDIEMCITDEQGAHALKREGSQGQCKTYLIAMKLAQFDFLCTTGAQTTPILLLDDIFDKLDSQRVEQIVQLVSSEQFGQIFITDTNRDHLDHILSAQSQDYRLFHVKNGKISC